MNFIDGLKKMFSNSNEPTSDINTEAINSEKLFNHVTQSNSPLSLTFNNYSISKPKSREQEIQERLDMYGDAFVRGIIDVKIGHALGATDSTSIPYKIEIKQDLEIIDEYKEVINKELKDIRNKTLGCIKTVAKDAEALSKGFVVVDAKSGVGIKEIIYNNTTSIRYMNEIKNNFSKTVAIEVAIESKRTREKDGKKYVSPDVVVCLNAESNGFTELQGNTLLQIEQMNPFSGEETFYEDFIYGGSFEGVFDHYNKYVWALEALFNARVSSSVIERFIVHNVDGLGADEVLTLKESLLNQIKRAGERLKQKVSKLDPSANTMTTYIPTMGDVNSVRIEDSDKNYNLSIDDILIHIKTFIGAIGYNLALTAYGDNQRGGEEEDGIENKSIIMDSQSDRIRDGVTKFLKELCKIHFKYKYLGESSFELDTDMIDVTFVSVTNKTQLLAETQRLQSINNSQQLGSILEQYKGLGLEDTENTRIFLASMIKSILPQNEENIDLIIKSHIDYILTPTANEEE